MVFQKCQYIIMQDGTSLINVAGHLIKDKVVQIVSDLGSSVDSTPKVNEDNMESQVCVMSLLQS